MDDIVDTILEPPCSNSSSSSLQKRKRESWIDGSDKGLPPAVTVSEQKIQESNEKELPSTQIIVVSIEENSFKRGDMEILFPEGNDGAVDSNVDENGHVSKSLTGKKESLMAHSGTLASCPHTASMALFNSQMICEVGTQIILGLVSDYFSLNGPDRSFSGGARFPGELLDVRKQWRKKYFYGKTTYYSLNEEYECPYGWMYTRFEITDNWKDGGTNGKGSIAFSRDSRKAHLVIHGLPRKGVDWSIKIWMTKV